MNIRDRLPFPPRKPQPEAADRQKPTAPTGPLNRARGTTPLHEGPAMARDQAAVKTSGPGRDAAQAAVKRLAKEGVDLSEFDRLAGAAETEAGAWRRVEVDNDVKGGGKAAVVNDPAAVKGAMAALTPEQRARYDQVARLTRQDRAAHAALEATLVSGRLTGADGKSALDALAGMAQPGALHPTIDPGSLIRDTIQELAVPDAIDQGARGTCVATAIQMKLAMDNPAEYARLAAGLASPEGKVTLASGAEIQREPGTEAPQDLQDAEGGSKADTRSTSTRLLSAAFMEHANGDNTYDDATDQHSNTGTTGLNMGQADRLMQGLGMNNASIQVNDGNRAQVFGTLEGKLAGGEVVPVQMQWGDRDGTGKVHDSHEILVTRVEGDQVFYNNPWGTQESMSKAEFQGRMQAISPSKPPADSVTPVMRLQLDRLDQLAPGTPAHKQQLDTALRSLDGKARDGYTRAAFNELAARYEQAGAGPKAEVLRALGDADGKVSPEVQRKVLHAIQDDKDTKDDLKAAMQQAGHAADGATIALIAKAAQAGGVDPGMVLRAAVDRRHDGESKAIDTARMAAIADQFEAHGLKGDAQALRAALGPGVGPAVREHLLNAVEDDKGTKDDLKQAEQKARTPEERAAIAQVRAARA